MAHKGSVMAAFQEGETRFLFARHRSGEPGLYELEDGAAVTVREYAKTELLCPVTDCSTPEITTVNRKRHRHGFRHLVRSTAHGPETLFHVEGKAQIAKWVRAKYPDAAVVEEQASSRRRERIADVMVTLADGQRIAIEIQYASIRPDDWQRRHDSYVAQGIRDVWLFGHQGAQLKAVANADQVRLNPTNEAVAAAGMPILWFNPEKMQVASVTTDTFAGYPFPQVAATSGVADISVEDVDHFSLTFERGLSHDRLNMLVDGSTGYQARLAADALAAAEKKERGEAQQIAWQTKVSLERDRLSEERRLELIRLEAINAAGAPARAKLAEGRRLKKAKLEDNADSRERAATEWPATADGLAILGRFNGMVPTYLHVYTYVVDLPIPSIVWQSHLFLSVIDRLESNAHVRHFDLAAELIARFNLEISDTESQSVVIAWCEHLKSAGVLSAGTSQWGSQYDVDKYRKGTGIVIVETAVPERAPIAPAPVPDALPVNPKSALPRYSDMFGPDNPEPHSTPTARAWRDQPWQAPGWRGLAPIPVPLQLQPEPSNCPACDGKIDPLLVPVPKYHPMCAPGFTGQAAVG